MIGLISYLAFFLTIALILAITVLGLNLQWGYTGLFNGGIVAFFGAGAYGLVLLGGPERVDGLGGFGLPYPLALLGGIAMSGLLAIVVGLATTPCATITWQSPPLALRSQWSRSSGTQATSLVEQPDCAVFKGPSNL